MREGPLVPVFEKNIIVEVARGIRACLHLEAGTTRAEATPGLDVQSKKVPEKPPLS